MKKFPSGTLRCFLILLLLSALVVSVFGRTANHRFVNFDDDRYVYGNPHVRSGWTADGVFWAFTTFHASNWHPLTWLSHMVDVELFGLNAGAHHLVNVGFHLANTLLLYLVLVRMTGSAWRSGFVAALFAVHPLHVESVAWISGRKDVLCAFFGMLTLLSYARYAERPGWERYLLVTASFTAGLLAKPMLVTLPFVLLLLDRWPLERAAGWGRLVREKIPLLLVSAGSCVVTYLAQAQGGSVVGGERIPAGVRAGNALVSYGKYLWKTVWPSGLAAFYPHPGTGLSGWAVAGAGAALAGVTMLAVWQFRRRPYVGVGWFWYMGTLVPVIGLVQVGGQAMADRYTYIPLIGVFLGVAWGASEAASRGPRLRAVLAASGGAAVASLAAAAWLQAGYWSDSGALFRRALEVTSGNWLAHNNLGMHLRQQGRTGEAIAQFEAAVRIEPGHPAPYVNLGEALGEQGRIGEAVEYYRHALRLNPDNPDAHYNLGFDLACQGKFDEAIPHFMETLRLRPGDADARYHLRIARSKSGK